MKRLLSFILGSLCLAVVIWLGLRASDNSSYVIWFGLAAAFLAPLCLAFLHYSTLGSDRETIKRLSDVAELKDVMEKAKSEKEQLQALQKERERLDAFVRYEAERMTLETRQAMLEADAFRIFDELETIRKQRLQLGVQMPAGVAEDQLANLQERLQASARRDIVFRFGNQNLVIPKNLVISLPFYGNMLYNFLAWHAGLLRKFRARKSERAAHPMDNPEN